jgi:FtsP/CotA-like multicopper oxidase with cupredoxin domain
MERITRRTAITLGGVGAVFVVAGGAGLLSQLSTNSGSPSSASTEPTGDEFAQPKLIRSANGVLDVALTASPSAVVVGGVTVNALTYNGSLPGPTLVVRPGDTMTVSLANHLTDPTNLHTHGLHVSPDGSSDNVFRRIDAGATAQYRYEIPADHPPGVFWYHPHHHGTAAQQVFGGLYGAIIVDDTTPIPATAERVLIVSDLTFDSAGTIATASQMDRMRGREGSTVLLNGQVNASISAHPGDRERWRIVNACTSRYLDLRLDGQSMQLLGNDSGRFGSPRTVSSIRLMPGNRADVLVTIAAGTSVLQAQPVDRGSAGGMGGGNASSASVTNLATLNVSGPVAAAFPPPPRSEPRDLRAQPLAGQRTLTLAMGGAGMGGGGMRFTIDGRAFDAARVDQSVTLGAIEEWTIVNTSTMDHPFHLHVWPMQVIEIGGQTIETPTWQDVVNVPAGSQSRVRIAFEDFTGTAVYHCHILDHEDNGMMGVIAVT